MRKSKGLHQVSLGIALTALLLVVMGNAEQAVSPRILDSVAEKLGSWQARRDAECRQKALNLAIVLADSMVMDYARQQKLMLPRPSRPLKPEEPELRRPSDTLQLAPFLGDTLGDLFRSETSDTL